MIRRSVGTGEFLKWLGRVVSCVSLLLFVHQKGDLDRADSRVVMGLRFVERGGGVGFANLAAACLHGIPR